MATPLFDCKSFIIMDKPHGIPTVPLKGQNAQDTLLGQAIKYDAQIMQVKGKNPWEGGALHRLDTVTGGLVVFAKEQSFYDYMQEAQKNGMFEKYYVARTTANDSLKSLYINEKQTNIIIESYFRPFGPGAKQVRPTLDLKRAKPKELYTTLVLRKTKENENILSETSYSSNDNKNDCDEKNSNTFFCTITKGFRHQIRAHLAWIGQPIAGDSLYTGTVPQSSLCNISNTTLCQMQNSTLGQTPKESQFQSETSIALDCVGLSFVDKDNKINCFMKKGLLFEDFAHTGKFAKNTNIAMIEL